MSSRSPLGYQNAQIAYIKWHGTVSPLYAWSETSGCGEQFAYIVYVYVYMRAVSCFSHVQLFATLWAVACQAPLSMGFSKQEYWSRLPCPPLGDLSDSGIKPTSLTSPAWAGRFFTTCTTWEALMCIYTHIKYTHRHIPHTHTTHTHTHTYIYMHIYIYIYTYIDLPLLTVRVCAGILIILNWKYHKLKMHLIYLTY